MSEHLPEVREVIAGLREGDEIEVTYRGIVDHTRHWYRSDSGHERDAANAVAIRVVKRAPLPEPPAGTPVWWNGKWWISDEAGAAYTSTLWAERDTVKFWQFMPGAVPAATPGGDDE